ncbi:MAG: hypothetical protein GY950_01445 [bacterium]|nr:hypothetical protein [bacterium]
MTNKISPRTRCIRGVLAAFLLSAGLVSLVYLSSPGKKENRFLSFNESFQPMFSAMPSKKDGIRLKSFKWLDHTRKKREATFHIPESALQDEVRRFGAPRSLRNSPLVEKRGFKIIGRRNYIKNREILERIFTRVDYKQIYQRNIKYFKELTGNLATSTRLSRGDDPLPPFLAFIQSIPYKLPPHYYKGKFIGSFFVPLLCLSEQYGDCDSKSLLLANFLTTFPGSREKTAMVLIKGNGIAHALLAVKRRPYPGMTSLFFRRKGYFVVLETTKPGWAPGFIDRRLADALKAGHFQFEELN